MIDVVDVTRVYHRPRTSLRHASPPLQALRGVSLRIGDGERVGLVGESGSGKSTLLRIIAGLDQPTSGSVLVDGVDIAHTPERRLAFLRRQLALVLQDPMGSLDPRMRVGEIIAEPLAATRRGTRAWRQQRVAQLLDEVGLPTRAAGRYPHQFSGGQRQRISIARALAGEPRILLADEPVSALDVSVRAQVLNLLADLADTHQLTLVLVAHDLAVVRHVCDRVVVMRDGQVVETGSTEQVYTAPTADYTRRLVAAAPTLRHVLATLTSPSTALTPAPAASPAPDRVPTRESAPTPTPPEESS